jgi:putative DNA primase/helicase
MDIKEATRGRWQAIFEDYGLGEYISGKHGPCPMCGGTDRFRVVKDDERGKWHCNQCDKGHGDGFDLVCRFTGKTFKEITAELKGKELPAPVERRSTDPRNILNRIWFDATPVQPGDLVATYLRNRGLTVIPEGLRYHPSCLHTGNNRRYPAMIARMVDVTGKPIGIHRTYLEKGQKAKIEDNKKTLTKESKEGWQIRLFQAGKILGVAEGIETAIACKEFFRVPTWATGNATQMEKFEPPPGVERLLIFGDCDKSYTGQKAAYLLANKLVNKMSVDVKIPADMGDWLDVMVEQQKSEHDKRMEKLQQVFKR